jgi:hypothetical protein
MLARINSNPEELLLQPIYDDEQYSPGILAEPRPVRPESDRACSSVGLI